MPQSFSISDAPHGLLQTYNSFLLTTSFQNILAVDAGELLQVYGMFWYLDAAKILTIAFDGATFINFDTTNNGVGFYNTYPMYLSQGAGDDLQAKVDATTASLYITLWYTISE